REDRERDRDALVPEREGLDGALRPGRDLARPPEGPLRDRRWRGRRPRRARQELVPAPPARPRRTRRSALLLPVRPGRARWRRRRAPSPPREKKGARDPVARVAPRPGHPLQRARGRRRSEV